MNSQNLLGKIHNYKITQNSSGKIYNYKNSQNSSGKIQEFNSRTKFINNRKLYYNYSRINRIYKENLCTHIKEKILNKIYNRRRSHTMDNHDKFQNLIRSKEKGISKTKNEVYSLEIKIRYDIKMNRIAELIEIRDNDDLYELIDQNLKKLVDEDITQSTN